MSTLNRDLRGQLETTVRAARAEAEKGAAKSLEQLGVAHAKAPAHLTPIQIKLRNALRAHGRQLGDLRNTSTGTQVVGRLTSETAYEHWHRMLFARFLAENGLLIEPDSSVAITLAECHELARELDEDWLALASRYAQTMLPQIFRAGDPVLEVSLPPETRSQLDDLLKGLPREVFTAEDSLGWVYQFWQADNKEAVNKSEKKIGADELSAVTQLFTEDYMVWFLLHNTLGAWWSGKVLEASPQLAVTATTEAELRAACAVGDIQWNYLRFVRKDGEPWRPAAGAFDGWPKTAKDITILDPCMGSGHFLVFALPILAAIRAQEEKLKPEAAIEAVLRDNLYGLELDPRCTQIAAFNLALAAWKRIGYRKLPALHVACSGLSLGVSKDEWLKLAESASSEHSVAPERDLLGTKKENLFSDATRRGFERLYELFARAPVLGSLIQPRVAGDLIESGFADLEPLLAKVLAKADSEELSEMAVAAQGLAKAAEILSSRYTLVATNVPYLSGRKQSDELKRFCTENFYDAKNDLGVTFFFRLVDLCRVGGSMAIVMAQGWLFTPSYAAARAHNLQELQWRMIAKLGAGAFETISGEVVNVMAAIWNQIAPLEDSLIATLDTTQARNPVDKARLLIDHEVATLLQIEQRTNAQSRIVFGEATKIPLLEKVAIAPQGAKTGDDHRWRYCMWEINPQAHGWSPYLTTVADHCAYGGRHFYLDWRTEGDGMVRPRKKNLAVGKFGVAISQTGKLPATLYLGERFDSNIAPVVPVDEDDLPALWAYCTSTEYLENVRRIDQSMKVTNIPLIQVPFDRSHWREVASERFPNGLPKPQTSDPTQWLFDGYPRNSNAPLHVAVARLVGYRWPRQTGSSFPNCPALGPDGLERHEDDDGIVPLTALKGDAGAAERTIALLQDAYGSEWSAAKLGKMLEEAGAEGDSLDDWLRDEFFEDHCALFHQKPFIWHIWDGRRDGFNVLVNYHRLTAGNGAGKRLLEKLTHSYLGDWIDVQRRDQKSGVEGADARLVTAEHLKSELENILIGNPPYDLFVRWKPLAEQSIGWDPDIGDGVRMNIRPFMTARSFAARARNACILRATPKIKWEKDGGKEPERSKSDFPWFWGWDESTQDFLGDKAFDGNRWNDLHYTKECKNVARAKRIGK